MTAKSPTSNAVVFMRRSVRGPSGTLIEQFRAHAKALAAHGKFADVTAADLRRMLADELSIDQESLMTIPVR